jgi:hypothetical protein
MTFFLFPSKVPSLEEGTFNYMAIPMVHELPFVFDAMIGTLH